MYHYFSPLLACKWLKQLPWKSANGNEPPMNGGPGWTLIMWINRVPKKPAA
jgi:hypothetical protein